MSEAALHLPTLAARLEWARKYRGLTVRALAREVGLSERQLHRLLVDHTTTAARMQRIAEVLRVDLAWLAYGKGVPFHLPKVVTYLASVEGKKYGPEVAKHLLEWPLEWWGTLTPEDDEIKEAAAFIDYRLHRARKRSHGDTDG